MTAFVYIMTNRARGTLYIGSTTDLVTRAHQHRTGQIDGFSKRYNLHQLVWFDTVDDVRDAMAHERRMKRWKRDFKIALVEKANPGWEDLFDGLSR